MALNKDKVIAAAQRFTQKGQLDRAIKEYRSIVEEDPDDIRVWLKIGDLYTRKGAVSHAVQTYSRVAEHYRERGFFQKAVAVYRSILKIDPGYIDGYLALGDLHFKLTQVPDAIVQFQIVVGAYERQGRQRESLDLLRRIVELAPEDVPNRIRLAEGHASQGEAAQAIEQFNRVLTQLEDRRRYDEFVQVGERLLYLAPDNLDVVRRLAEIYVRVNEPKRALARLQAAFRADPRDPQTLDLLARTFVALDQVSKAVSVYRELAHVHLEGGRQGAAGKVWRRLLELDPGDPEALEATGASGEVAEPVGAGGGGVFEQLSETDQIRRYLDDVDLLLKYELSDHAVARVGKALALNPQHRPSLRKQADLLVRLRRFPEAVTCLLTLARIEESHDTAAARHTLEEVLAHAPENDEARARLARLAHQPAAAPRPAARPAGGTGSAGAPLILAPPVEAPFRQTGAFEFNLDQLDIDGDLGFDDDLGSAALELAPGAGDVVDASVAAGMAAQGADEPLGALLGVGGDSGETFGDDPEFGGLLGGPPAPRARGPEQPRPPAGQGAVPMRGAARGAPAPEPQPRPAAGPADSFDFAGGGFDDAFGDADLGDAFADLPSMEEVPDDDAFGDLLSEPASFPAAAPTPVVLHGQGGRARAAIVPPAPEPQADEFGTGGFGDGVLGDGGFGDGGFGDGGLGDGAGGFGDGGLGDGAGGFGGGALEPDGSGEGEFGGGDEIDFGDLPPAPAGSLQPRGWNDAEARAAERAAGAVVDDAFAALLADEPAFPDDELPAAADHVSTPDAFSARLDATPTANASARLALAEAPPPPDPLAMFDGLAGAAAPIPAPPLAPPTRPRALSTAPPPAALDGELDAIDESNAGLLHLDDLGAFDGFDDLPPVASGLPVPPGAPVPLVPPGADLGALRLEPGVRAAGGLGAPTLSRDETATPPVAPVAPEAAPAVEAPATPAAPAELEPAFPDFDGHDDADVVDIFEMGGGFQAEAEMTALPSLVSDSPEFEEIEELELLDDADIELLDESGEHDAAALEQEPDAEPRPQALGALALDEVEAIGDGDELAAVLTGAPMAARASGFSMPPPVPAPASLPPLRMELAEGDSLDLGDDPLGVGLGDLHDDAGARAAQAALASWPADGEGSPSAAAPDSDAPAAADDAFDLDAFDVEDGSLDGSASPIDRTVALNAADLDLASLMATPAPVSTPEASAEMSGAPGALGHPEDDADADPFAAAIADALAADARVDGGGPAVQADPGAAPLDDFDFDAGVEAPVGDPIDDASALDLDAFGELDAADLALPAGPAHGESPALEAFEGAPGAAAIDATAFLEGFDPARLHGAQSPVEDAPAPATGADAAPAVLDLGAVLAESAAIDESVAEAPAFDEAPELDAALEFDEAFGFDDASAFGAEPGAGFELEPAPASALGAEAEPALDLGAEAEQGAEPEPPADPGAASEPEAQARSSAAEPVSAAAGSAEVIADPDRVPQARVPQGRSPVVAPTPARPRAPIAPPAPPPLSAMLERLARGPTPPPALPSGGSFFDIAPVLPPTPPPAGATPAVAPATPTGRGAAAPLPRAPLPVRPPTPPRPPLPPRPPGSAADATAAAPLPQGRVPLGGAPVVAEVAAPVALAAPPSPAPAAAAPAASSLQEVDFLLENHLLDDAEELLLETERSHPGHAEVVTRRARLTRLRAEEVAADEALGGLFNEAVDTGSIHGAQLSDLGADDASTHFDLGVAFKEMQQYRKAIEQLEIAARAPALRPEALRVLGLVHLEQGDAGRAIERLEEALGIPGLADGPRSGIEYDLASVYESRGDRPAARARLAAIVARDPSFHDAKARLARLGH